MRILASAASLAFCLVIGLPGPAGGQEDQPVAGPQARVQAGDRVSVRVFREAELSDTVTVGLDGEVVLPRLGRVYVLDLTAGELQEELRTGYARYLRNPTVEVLVLRRIGVHGEVRRPDLYLVDLTMTLRDVIAQAGGLTPEANPGRISLIRDGERIAFRGRDIAQVTTAELRSGDQVMVDRRTWIQRNPLGTISGVLGFVVGIASFVNWVKGS